jgi:YD repeat-containing protein
MLFSAVLLAQAPITFQYFYDDTGQLIKVVDSTGIVIDYVYDAVGNMTQIKRSAGTPGALAILNFTPQQGGPLTKVTISGQGFSTTTTANTVKFNGTTATVVSATSTTLVVTVPTGATTGLITVTVGANSAFSPSPFTVTAAPVITSVAPHGALANTTVGNFKVTGINLTGSTFTFVPAFVPAAIGVSSVSIDPSGTSATMSLAIGANAAGTFTLVATNAAGASSAFPSPATSISVVVNANADPDGDGLSNALEIQFGTDPLNPDTDGDGFSDAVEVASASDPLDPACTPLNCRISGNVITQNISVSNTGPTPNTPQESDTKTFAVLNTSATMKAPIEADGKPFSVLSIAPTTKVPIEADTLTFSVLNAPITITLEADTVPHSVCNMLAGPNSCSNYSGLALVSNFQSTGGNQEARAIGRVPGPADGRPFSVVAVAPTNQATNVAPESTIAIVFSAPLDPASISSSHFLVSAGDVALEPEIRYSADFRVVTMSAPIPADRVVRVSVLGDVRDLWGRELRPFQSEFRTAAASRETAVVAQRPPHGATEIRPDSTIHLALAQAMDWNRVYAALRITQEGEPVEGSIQIERGGKEVEFVPYSPLRAGAVVKVSMGEGYEGLFTIAVPPVDRVEPARAAPGRTAGAPLNAVIEIEYSRPLDNSSVNASNVILREASTLQPVLADVTLRGDHIVRVVPRNPLLPGISYIVDVSANLKDLNGEPASALRGFLTTGRESTFDSPRLLSVTPLNGATSIDRFSELRLAFDRAVNPLTVHRDTVFVTQDNVPLTFSLSFAANGKDVVVTPLNFLTESSRVELTVSGVEDVAGNRGASFTVRFQVRGVP